MLKHVPVGIRRHGESAWNGNSLGTKLAVQLAERRIFAADGCDVVRADIRKCANVRKGGAYSRGSHEMILRRRCYELKPCGSQLLPGCFIERRHAGNA